MRQGDASRLSVPPIGRTALWLALFLLFSASARDSALFDTGEPVVGPSVAVALLWLASGVRSTFWIDTAVLGLATVGVSIVSADEPWLAALGPVMVLPAVLTAVGLRRWLPETWGGGGRCAMSTLTEFGRFLVLVVVTTVGCTALRTALGVLLVDGATWEPFLLRAGRTIASLVALGTFGLLLGGRLAERRDLGTPVVTFRFPEALELALVGVYTSLVLWVGFLQHPHVPSTFLIALGVVWISVRFSPLASATGALVAGGAAATMTLEGHGPIAVVEDLGARALMAQVFVVVMMVTGLAVSLSRRQVVETVRRLRHSEEALVRRADELDLMLETLSDGVAIVEEGGRIAHSNSALRRLLTGADGVGFDSERIQPADQYRLFHPDGRPMSDDEVPYLRALRGETVQAEQFHLRRPSLPGGRVLEMSAIKLPQEPDQPPRAMATVRDVTAETAHRDALADFAGTVAHDLNRPLTVITGWAEALEEEFRAEPAVASTTGGPMVANVRASADRMREFISDLLAHAVARDQDLHGERVPLRNVVKDLEDARLGPGTAHFHLEAEELPDVWADRALVTQLLDNLIGNAVKYVEPGTPPHVRITGNEANGWATVKVCDNGIGIPEKHRQRVFDSFHRAGRNEYEGTGLGLSICKRIVERHGGTIAVEDNPAGRGSCLTFTLPTTPQAYAAARRTD